MKPCILCVRCSFFNKISLLFFLFIFLSVWISSYYSRGRKHRKLLDYLKESRGYSHLKEIALACTIWRAWFGRGFGPLLRRTTKWMNEYHMTNISFSLIRRTVFQKCYIVSAEVRILLICKQFLPCYLSLIN
jgi:hypothetical protein